MQIPRYSALGILIHNHRLRARDHLALAETYARFIQDPAYANMATARKIWVQAWTDHMRWSAQEYAAARIQLDDWTKE